jgi:hypothetical protein
VQEHVQFRDGVSCVGVLVGRDSETYPWWAVVASTRAEEVPPELTWHTLRAAEDLVTTGPRGAGRPSG